MVQSFIEKMIAAYQLLFIIVAGLMVLAFGPSAQACLGAQLYPVKYVHEGHIYRTEVWWGESAALGNIGTVRIVGDRNDSDKGKIIISLNDGTEIAKPIEASDAKSISPCNEEMDMGGE